MKNGKAGKLSTLADRSLENLLREYDDYLFKDFLPFMDSHIFDHEHGGFKCNTDQSGRNISTNKRTWYDGRGIWVYSFLYNHIEKNTEYLDVAKKTVDLVLKTKHADELFWPWAYDYKGKDLKEFPPDIYGNLFVAEGFAEYSIATNDATYWHKAKDILLECVAEYDRVDYSYLLEYSPQGSSFTHAERVLGHWMIILRLTTSLLKIHPDKEVEEINSRCIDALIVTHFNQKFNLMNEVSAKDFSQVSEEIEQFVYIGHAIESLWMIMDEGLRRNDCKLFELAAERFKFHVEVAWDDVYGGIFHCLDHVDNNKWLLDKVLWAQEEVLVGIMLLIEHNNDPWAVHWFDKMYNYVLKDFSQKQEGFILWKIGGNRNLTAGIQQDRIENYHHPRHLMLNSLAIKNIIKKQL